MSNDKPVVGYWNSNSTALQYPVQHLPSVPHAGSAVYDKFVFGEIGREIMSLHGVDIKLAAYVLCEPTGYFDAPYIVSNRVMRTRFGDEDSVAGFEIIYG
jgi:hypothetical protein